MTSTTSYDGNLMTDTEVKEANEVFLTNNKLRSSHVKHDDLNYKMDHDHRGKIIIFNHEKYDIFVDNGPLGDRTGTDKDAVNLTKTLQGFNFTVEIYNDLKSAEIQELLEAEANNEEWNYSSDCLIIVILTHGEEDGLVYAFDHSYQVETIWDKFTADNCRSLAGKPKVFLVQACRGRERSTSHRMNDSTIHADGTANMDNFTKYSIPSEADMLIVFSTYKGKVAHRDTLYGTWFVNSLCKELELTGKTDDALSILTRVNRRVAIDFEHQLHKQMPMIQSTLTRKIYFGDDGNVDCTDSPGLESSDSKLDLIIEMLRNVSTPSSKSDTNTARRMTSEWAELQIKTYSSSTAVDESQILSLGKALKTFLEDCNDLRKDVFDDGLTILNLLSMWKHLTHELRCFVNSRLVFFLKTHAKDWKYFGMISFPEMRTRQERCNKVHRRSSLTSENSSRTGSGSGRRMREQWK